MKKPGTNKTLYTIHVCGCDASHSNCRSQTNNCIFRGSCNPSNTMKKIFLFAIGFIFISVSIASACNFRISFVDPKEKVKIEPLPLLMPDRFGGESLIIPIEDLCKTNQSLYGTTVIYLYLENKLSDQLYRPNG